MHAAQALGTYLETFLKRVQSVEKIDWLITDIDMTPSRAERAILGVILPTRLFRQFKLCLWP